MRYKIVNVDRVHALPGVSSEYDTGYVYDTTITEPHPITGKPQYKHVFTGSLIDCHSWVHDHEGAS